jgi:NADH-quinone oxidoreductase subunit L
MQADTVIPNLLTIAWLLPLASFAIISIAYSLPQLFGSRASYAIQPYAAYVSIGAIGLAFVLSIVTLLGYWLPTYPLSSHGHAEHGGEHHHESSGHDEAGHDAGGNENHDPSDDSSAHLLPSHWRSSPFRWAAETTAPATTTHNDAASAERPHNNSPPPSLSGNWYTLAKCGNLEITLGYYIDALTVTMFCMVTLIATCVHVYAMGYMHDELHDFTDPEVTDHEGNKFQRPGRFHRFFQYLSLFCFSMLGIVIAGNLAMVFVFWELVGICSYFLIGFYIERKSASNAANKAFIVNRVGDFGMLIGLMALWSTLGTFNFGDITQEDGTVQPGIFSQLHTAENHYHLEPTSGMVEWAARDKIQEVVLEKGGAAIPATVEQLRHDPHHQYGHWLLFIAGVGLFCGCIGKSAQFPLQVWLPDAMEGPTPVSALVHSATMVAAGVYLVGRSYPIFIPEVLLVIAAVGSITLFLAATIAITATDIKRVLAYSTVSQLGYMMLGLGLGGFVAGLFHLITHAFFKGLLFLCSGSVIHAVHTNEMTEMGGLRKKMPITAYTMLIGCLAIIGAGLPIVHLGYFGLSGFFSKDAIIEQSLSHMTRNEAPWLWLLFLLPVVGALMTAFYMFRLWFMTFAGQPRNEHRFDHAHESPRVMTIPLIILAIFAIGVAWEIPGINLSVPKLLEQARPIGTLATVEGTLVSELVIPTEHDSHADEIRIPAGLWASGMAAAGVLLAALLYLWRVVDPAALRHNLLVRPFYALSWHKWWFDELYDLVFVKPTLWIGRFVAGFDRSVIDSILHACTWICRAISVIVDVVGDRTLIDRTVDGIASYTWRGGLSLRRVQTGRLRQYIMFLVVGTIILFMIASIWRAAVAG